MKSRFGKIKAMTELLYNKYKEYILYLVFGGLTTAVSIGSFAVFNHLLYTSVHVANGISWILSVTFAFYTNRKWVFAEASEGTVVGQFFKFSLARVMTFVFEEILLVVFVDMLLFPAMAVKILAQIAVVVLNYVVSKLFVFKKK